MPQYLITTQERQHVYICSEQNTNLQQQKQLPYVINNAPRWDIEKIETHSFVGFVSYAKNNIIKQLR